MTTISMTPAPRPAGTFVSFAARIARRGRRGLTLFGVLMGLALVAGAVVGTLALYNQAQETSGINKTMALLTRLQVSVQNIYQGEGRYPNGSLIDALDARGSIPGDARLTTTTVDGDGNNVTNVGIRHAFGGGVTVNGNAAGDRFDIVLADIEDETCAQLLDPYVGQTRGASGLWQVLIDGTALASPLTTAAVADNCDNAPNDMTFRFE